MNILLWVGAAGAWLFVIVFLVDGATRAGYHPIRHAVSALALGSRGWVQTTNFVLCGIAVTMGAVGIGVGNGDVLLAIAIGVFGVSLVASGVFPMDPMRDYPPGAPSGTPEDTTLRHRLHDVAGMAVFVALPVAAAIATFTVEDPVWQWWSGLTAVASTAGFFAFGQAWENDSPRTGLIQKATMLPGWIWLGALLARGATQ